MAARKKAAAAPAELSKLQQIKEDCKNQKYCHDCRHRTFCTKIRAIKPAFWSDTIIKEVEA